MTVDRPSDLLDRIVPAVSNSVWYTYTFAEKADLMLSILITRAIIIKRVGGKERQGDEQPTRR